jgi:hypothetical protein
MVSFAKGPDVPLVDVAPAFRAARCETQEGQQHELRRRAQSPDHKQCRQKNSIQAMTIAALPIIV